MSIETPDLFPHLPRSTVPETKRELWNDFKRAQEELGGLVPSVVVCHLLKISRSRLSQLCKAGLIRSYTILGYTSYSTEDVKARLALMRDPEFASGGYRMHASVK
jgi:hypothetical protein